MATDAAAPRLARIDLRLVKHAAIGGLLGGLVLFLIMASYEATQGMGFASILNACFAAFVFKSARMSPMGAMSPHMTSTPMSGSMPSETMPGSTGMMHHSAMTAHSMMNGPIVASHVTVGGLLHLVMSAGAGIAFAIVLALAIRAGLRPLANPLGYVLAAATGGALLYVIMMYGVAPWLNPTIQHFTPRTPFLLSHLAFGATVGAVVYALRVRLPWPSRAASDHPGRLQYGPAQ